MITLNFLSLFLIGIHDIKDATLPFLERRWDVNIDNIAFSASDVEK